MFVNVQHKNGVVGGACRCGKIVQAVVQDAYHAGVKRVLGLHERGAIHADGAQVGGGFVKHQLQAVAVELGIAFLGHHQGAFALAIGNQQLCFRQHFVAFGFGVRGVFGGQAVDQLLDAQALVLQGVFNVRHQLALVAQPPRLALHRGFPLKRAVAAPQLRLLLLKRCAPRIYVGNVLRKQRAASADGVHLEQRVRNAGCAKRPRFGRQRIRALHNARGFVRLRASLLGLEDGVAFFVKNLQVERQLAKRIFVP